MFRMEEMRGTRIAYMRRVGPYGADNKEQMEKLKRWAGSSGLMQENAVILGIARDDPATTPPENCRYDACIVVSEDTEIGDDGVNEAVLPGGRYAVFTVRHTAEDIQRAWSDILPELASHGCSPDMSRPILERYIPGMVKKHLCEICVPLPAE
jgi:DNA gyrase inhibitor GyrI